MKKNEGAKVGSMAGGKVVRISKNADDLLTALSKETGKSKNDLATMIILWAYDFIEVDDKSAEEMGE